MLPCGLFHAGLKDCGIFSCPLEYQLSYWDLIIVRNFDVHSSGEQRYRLNDALSVVRGCVMAPWDRVAIARHYAWPYAPANAPINLPNRGFQEDA
jgi:hypothetical protein